MQRLAVLVIIFSAIALAETWNGKLVDASCANDQADPSACSVTDSTKLFGLQMGNAVYRLDKEGNAKVARALRDRADRIKEERPGSKEPIQAKITGRRDQDLIRVESVQIK